MSSSNRKTEATVGLFIFIGLALLGALILQFGRFEDRFGNKYPLTVVFDDAAGLIKGSEVRMGGARIGKVAETPVLTDEVKVQVELDVDERIRIPRGSSFKIASATLLGDKLIVITPPEKPAEEVIPPGSVIQGSGSEGLEAIQSNAVEVSREARRLLVEAKDTVHRVDAAIDDIRTATQELTVTLRKINTSILSDKNLDNLEKTFANLEEATGDLRPTIGEARQAIASVERAADNAGEAFDQAGDRIADLEPALREIPSAVASLSRAADQAADTLERVEQGQGLIGTLAYDEEVAEDTRTFIKNLKQQGILRYRDAETPEDDPRERFRGKRR